MSKVFTLLFMLSNLGCTDQIPDITSLFSSQPPSLSQTQMEIDNTLWGSDILISGTCNKKTDSIKVSVANSSPVDLKQIDSSANLSCESEGSFSFNFRYTSSSYPELGLQDIHGNSVEVKIYSYIKNDPSSPVILSIQRVQPGIDNMPDAFNFTNNSIASTSTLVESDIIQITGIDIASDISISGDGAPEYRVCNDSSCSNVLHNWTSMTGSGNVINNNYVQIQLTSSASNASPFSATLTVGATAGGSWTVTTSTNAAPTITSAACSTSGVQNTVYSCVNTATDAESETLSWSFDSTTNTCNWLSIDPNTGNISGSPGDDDVGDCILAFLVTDTFPNNSIISSTTLTINNIAPTLTITDAAAILQGAAASIIRVDADVEADEEGFGIYSFDHATTTAPKCSDNTLDLTLDNTTGAVTYQPAANYTGTCNIKVVFNDGNASSNTVASEFAITVNVATNIAPVISQTCAISLNQDAAYTCSPTFTDADGPGPYVWGLDVTNNTCAWANINATSGVLSGVPNDDDVGSCILAYKVNDGTNDSLVTSLNITVSNVTPSLIIADAASILEDAASSIIRTDAMVQASEEGFGVYSFDHASTTAPKCSDHTLGLTIDSSSGAVTFQPATNYSGTCNIKVVFDDGNATSNTIASEFAITVNPVNDAPVILSLNCAASPNHQDVSFVCSPILVDPDSGDTHTWSIAAANTCAWINTIDSATGAFFATPNDDNVGDCILAMDASDGIISTSSTLTVTIVNVAPVLSSSLVNIDIYQDANFAIIKTDADVQTDEEGFGTYSFGAASSLDCSAHAEPGGFSINATNGAVSFQPAAGFAGLCNINVRFDDGNSGIIGDEFAVNVLDITPDNIAFPAPLHSVYRRNSVVTSYPLQITGINTAVEISIIISAGTGSSPEYRICTDGTSESSCESSVKHGWTNALAIDVVDNNDYVQIRFTTATSYSQSSAVILDVGNTYSSSWSITTIHPPSAPIGSTKSMAVGDEHICALNAEGKVLCWGSGLGGRLGQGNVDDQGLTSYPDEGVIVNLGPSGFATEIVAGRDHTCALMASGDVFCWGGNSDGELGHGNILPIGDNEDPLGAGMINLGQKALSITAGQNHTCAILVGGDSRCWGNGSNGRLGYNNVTNLGDGAGETPSFNGPIPLGAVTGVPIQIEAGDSHTCVLLSSGKAKCWGYGFSGQLGNALNNTYGASAGIHNTASAPLVTLTNPIKQISANFNHTCALLTDGNISCWGVGTAGRLGYGDTSDVLDPETKGYVLSGEPAVQIATGRFHSCALLATGNARCWGLNNVGQLGLGHTTTVGDTASPTADVDLGGERVRSIYAGGNQSCAILVNGHVKCWGGDGLFGEMGLGPHLSIGDNEFPKDMPYISLGGSVNAVIKLVVGAYHSCTLLANGSINCWGDAANGKTTIPTGLNLAGSTVDLYIGANATCAIRSSGIQECWGDPVNSQTTLSVPYSDANYTKTGDGGLSFMCSLGVTGDIGCRGNNAFTQLSDLATAGVLNTYNLTLAGSTRELYAGYYHGAALSADGKIINWGPDDKGQLSNIPANVDGPGEALTASAGFDFTCAIDSLTNKVHCWGFDYALGTGNLNPTNINLTTARKVSAEHDSACGVTTDGKAKCWGYINTDNPIASITGKVIDVGTGAFHACALLSSGKVTCWEENSNDSANGQLTIPASIASP
ncbi:MAG: hypothetical protein HOO06_08770 [Bdellovibrionaceae bacterium]|nr:hypothetical protein [Pseudobdellovibrionaceae bacterium]